MNLHELFAIPRQRTPHKVALEYVDDADQPQQVTYAQLYGQVDALAAGLQKWGLRKGDRVAFYLNNRLEFVVSYLAVLRAGAIMVPVNLRYRRLEIAHILDDSAPRLMITERAQLSILDELQPDEKASVEAILPVEEMDSWLADAAELTPPVVEADDLGL
ncbi:MAG: acyl--CoA ligase, partial [Caldilineaceae bacterium]|nr:acyl--CoA ligase [Caldilineaceae bacterium]